VNLTIAAPKVLTCLLAVKIRRAARYRTSVTSSGLQIYHSVRTQRKPPPLCSATSATATAAAEDLQ
jgi:hypothetical protein